MQTKRCLNNVIKDGCRNYVVSWNCFIFKDVIIVVEKETQTIRACPFYWNTNSTVQQIQIFPLVSFNSNEQSIEKILCLVYNFPKYLILKFKFYSTDSSVKTFTNIRNVTENQWLVSFECPFSLKFKK